MRCCSRVFDIFKLFKCSLSTMSQVVVYQILLLGLLCSVVPREGNAAECSESFYSENEIDRKNGNSSHSVTFTLMHKYGKCSPFRPPNSTWESLISEMIKADRNRLKHMRRSTEDVAVPVASGTAMNVGDYIIKMNIGRPAQSFYAVIDTGSDVTWIRCKPCWICDPHERYLFKPSKSASYQVLGCHSKKCLQVDPPRGCLNSKCIFQQSYGDQSGFVAMLSTDSLSVGSRTVPHFAFGCVEIEFKTEIELGPGLIGLGRGNLSFVSQTVHLYDKTFSYCLPSFESEEFSGSLVFGMEALNVKRVKFTPLLTNPVTPSFYYVGLKGISVGGELLSIPPSTFALNTSNGGGTIIDSGSTLTSLVEPAYSTLRDAFSKKLSNLKNRLVESDGLDTCYNISSGRIKTPPITFHFEGGLDLELTQENILRRESNTVWCLAFAATSDPPAIIGNVQQQNWRVVYDIPHARLGFARERCNA